MNPIEQGLSGLTAYGIILLVNEKLSQDIKRRTETGDLGVTLAIRDFLYLWGILFLGGVIGHIVVLSEVVPLKLHDYAIITITASVLAGPIVAFHLPIFKASFKFIRKNQKFTQIDRSFINNSYGTWVFAYIGFIITGNLLYIILWTIAPTILIIGALYCRKINFLRYALLLITLSIFILSFIYSI